MVNSVVKKIVYIGYAVSENEVENASGISIAGNKMQLNMLRELVKYTNIEIEAITIYPCAKYPIDKKLFYHKKEIELFGNFKAIQISFINIPVIKQVCQIFNVYNEINKKLKEQNEVEVFTFNMYPQVGTALRVLKKKYKSRLKIVSMLADLPIDTVKRRGLSKKLMDIFYNETKKNIRIIDKAIVLNAFAAEKYLCNQEYIVVEGGIVGEKCKSELSKVFEYDSRERTIVYSGALVEYNGIRELLRCMELVQTDVVLEVYGNGPLKSYVEQVANSNKKVKYMGNVTNEKMLEIQRKAYALINPRPIEDPISKVTFPSKIFEYLLSGTVVLSTKLNGFSEEYYDKMIWFEEDNAESMAKTVDSVMRMPTFELSEMAENAREFVISEKTWEKQGKKIYDLLVN